MKSIQFYRITTVIILLVVSLSKLLYFQFSDFSLFSEETQYWLWSKHLDLNYYSKPLMIAVYNFIATSIFGDTDFAIKFNAVFFSMATAWVVFEFTLDLYQKPKISFWAALILIVMPFFHIGSIFHTTDSSLYFFWILSFYLIWKAVSSDDLKWWVLAGIATLMGILSKNIMILSIPILGLFFLFTEKRRIFTRGFWIYVFVSCLAFLPILYWNIQHDFVTFRHVGTLGGIEGNKGEFNVVKSLKYIGEYVGGQLGFMSPFFVPLLWVSIRNSLKERDEKALFLLLPTIFVWLLFFAMAIFKNVNVNWPAFAILTLPILMADFLGKSSSFWKKYTLTGGTITGALLLLLFFPGPADSLGFKKILKPAKDPMARLVGYRELGERLDHLIDSLALQNNFIFSDSYHLASEMAFYVHGNPQTYAINLGRRKNQFDLWPGIEQYEGKPYAGIYLTIENTIPDVIVSGFESFIQSEKFYTFHRGDTVRTFQIAIFKNLKHIEEVNTGTY